MIGRILPIFLIILAIAIFVAYIDPVYTKDIVPLKAQIKEYDSTLKAAEDFNQKEAQLATARNAIPDTSIARLDAFLPDSVDNVQLILDVTALATRAGLKLTDFSTDANNVAVGGSDQSSGQLPLSTGQKFGSLRVDVKASGSYAAFRAFLSGIEQSLRPLDITDVSITNGANGLYTYDIIFTIYWLQ